MKPVAITFLLLVAAPVAGAAVPANPAALVQESPAQRAVDLLIDSVRDGECEPVALRQALAEVQPTPVETLVNVYGHKGIPADEAVGARAFVSIDVVRRQVIRQVLQDVPLARLRPVLERVAREEPRLNLREAAVTVLGGVGVARDVPLLLSLAAPLRQGSDVLPRGHRKTLEMAVTEFMERDTRSFQAFLGNFADTHVGLRSSLVRAAERIGSEDSLRFLVGLLSRDPELDQLVLTSIARNARVLLIPVDEQFSAEVRPFLAHRDDDVARAAARAVGALQDYQGIGELLEMLSEGTANTRSNAHRALRDLTGLSFGPDPDRWNDWYSRETSWWEREAPRLVAGLESRDVAAVVHGIGVLSVHHLYRHDLAASLALCLRRDEPEVLRHACHALGRLGSGVGVVELVDCLDHADGSVRHAALDGPGARHGLAAPAGRRRLAVADLTRSADWPAGLEAPLEAPLKELRPRYEKEASSPLLSAIRS